jgi:cytochrome subunit of sulfide dehydrogenase
MARKTGCQILAALLALAFALPASAAPDDGCADCHGKDGASTESDVPVIGGVSETYLNDTMAAYRDSKRPCAATAYRAGDKKRPKTDMCKIAAKLSAEETAAVSKDLAADPFVKAKQKFDAAKAATGKKIHDTACEKCHSEGGALADDDAGILAGQWMSYLKDTFAQYTKGSRPQPEKMKVKFNALKPDEQEALLHYYASQQ